MDHALPQPEALAMRTDERGKRDTDIRERLEKNDQKISNFLKRQCNEKNTTLEQKSGLNRDKILRKFYMLWVKIGIIFPNDGFSAENFKFVFF